MDGSGWLVDGLGVDEIEGWRRHTRTGRPLGEPGFVERLEFLLGRVLRPGKRGPKPKNPADRRRREPERAELK